MLTAKTLPKDPVMPLDQKSFKLFQINTKKFGLTGWRIFKIGA